MKRLGVPLMRRFLKDERGQGFVMALVTVATTVAMASTTLETGHVYWAYQKLVASTNAAALAGAQVMPDTTQATSTATQFSSVPGNLNASPLFSSVSLGKTPTYGCDTASAISSAVACENGNNYIQVTQTATVPMWFAGIVGMSSMNMTASAMALMKGGTTTPYNIVVLMDTTPSMSFQDPGNKQCNGTQEACALQGFRALLGLLYPCQVGQTCNSGSATPVDAVSLFVFPAVTVATEADDYTCTKGKMTTPTPVAYTFPDTQPPYTAGTAPASNLQLPSTDTYQITDFLYDYKTSDGATTLNPLSDLVIAAGGKSGCAGLQPTFQYTYYAQAIYAAQAALVAQTGNNKNVQNAMIILSDGDAQAGSSTGNTSAGASTNSNPWSLVATADQSKMNGTGTSTSPNYPSALGECGQAVQAAQYAKSQGTKVITIGYGSPTTNSCTTDKKYSLTVSSPNGQWSAGKQACDAIGDMASDVNYFFSDNGNGCKSTSNTDLTSLTQIFQKATSIFSAPRLIASGM